ncbi:cytochrome P450 [Truncatella angustata]|uniref:Cytochrome P450 n=1 Tax=Truncatella angustata TaxID=152316 RepID=A0A9P8UPG4_9PEZI|nr:cytochrome P450 [Truncatella angustata]KAH6655953.1 cytochrome P450 [Truncatella angustata]
MDATNGFSSFLTGLSSYFSIPVILVLSVVLLSSYAFGRETSHSSNGLSYLPESIPYVSNTFLFMTDMAAFLERVSEVFEATNSEVVKCYVGFRPCYFVASPQNVQRLFGSPEILDGNFIHYLLMGKQWGMTKAEMAKFREDRSGRLPKPAPGFEGLAADKRYWRNHNRLYTDYLTDTRHSDALAMEFSRRFAQRLDRQCEGLHDGGWASMRLLGTLRKHMSECAAETLFGTRLFDLNPGFTECYWAYDEVAGRLLTGPPGFLQPRAARAKHRLHAMVRRHIDAAWANFDSGCVDVESLWEPHFGSHLSRESARWLREQGFSDHTAAGHTLATLFGLNGNTVPITAWALAELLQDPKLLNAVRSEVLTESIDAETGELDARRVVSLPLLQSLYTETMRLHVSFAVTREVRDGPFEIAPGCWIEKGAIVQTCSTIAHLDEEVWAIEGHPAREFWAWRHVRTEESRDERTGDTTTRMRFAMNGRPTSFFPYGGGHWVCPGRHFGKMEIMLALALIVTKFDLEFVQWTHLDGAESDRPAQNDGRYAGSIAMFPDRDLSFRWRKIRSPK